MNKHGTYNSTSLNYLKFGRPKYDKNLPWYCFAKSQFIHETTRLRLIEDVYKHEHIQIFCTNAERWYTYYDGTPEQVKSVWENLFKYRDKIK